MWDGSSGFGAPAFVSELPPFHPLTIAAGQLLTSPRDLIFVRLAAGVLTAAFLYLLLRRLHWSAIAATLSSTCTLAVVSILFKPAAVLLVLGVISSLAALHGFVRSPARWRWSALTVTLAVAILGDRFALLPLVVLPMGAFLVATTVRSDYELRGSIVAGALAAAIVSALGTAWWWLPLREISKELSQLPAGAQKGRAIRPALQGNEPIRILELSAPADSLFQTTNLVAFRPLVQSEDGRWLLASAALDFLNIGAIQAHSEKGDRLDFNAGALPRFFFAESFAIESSRERAAERLARVSDFRSFATVDHIPEKVRTLAANQLEQALTGHPFSLPGGRVNLESYRPGQARLRVVSDGWNVLVSSEPSWPGWRAYWNGQRLPAVVVDAAFFGTFVPPGQGSLILRYRPREFDVGLRLSALALAAFLLTVIYPWYLRAPTPSLFKRAIPRKVVLVPWGRFAVPAVLFLFASYAVVLFSHRVYVAGGADSSGYLNQGRLWSHGELVVPLVMVRELQLSPSYSYLFAPLGFIAGPSPATMVPVYPPGVPLHLALLRLLGGDAAMFWFGPLAAVASLLLMYSLGRSLGLSRAASVAGAAILATCPVLVSNGLYPVSDVAATAWAMGTIVAALRSQASWHWGIVAGAALGVGVLVRPSQLLILPAVALAAGLRGRSLLAIAAGGVPFAIFQMLIAHHLYGNPLLTGYGRVWDLFSWNNFLPRFKHYSFWLGTLLSPLVFPLGLAALFVRTIDRYTRAAMGLWFLAFFVFYCFYHPYGDWGATRFLLPAAPALIYLAILGSQNVLGRLHPDLRRATALILLLMIVGSGLAQTVGMHILRAADDQRTYRDAVVGARKYLSSRPIVLAMELGGAYYYYTGETAVNWARLTPEEFAMLRAHASVAGRKWYALLSQPELSEAMRRTPGDWVPIARFRQVTLFELRS